MTGQTPSAVAAAPSMQDAISNLDKLQNWFMQKIAPQKAVYPDQYKKWLKEIGAIREQITRKSNIRVALLGSTGAGKSTFLNAVLGQEVLPVGVMEPCTAFVTVVRYQESGGYSIAIEYLSQDEWQQETDLFLATLEPGDGPADNISRQTINAYRKKMEALYGVAIDPNVSLEALPPMVLPEDALNVFKTGRKSKAEFENAKDMLGSLRPLVRKGSALWPLVKKVTISGPYECLKGGIEIVDLPGLNDPNEARMEVTREYLRSAPFVWMVFPMVRGLTKDLGDMLINEKLLRALVLSGSYNALSLVGTKADEIDVNAADQFGLDPDTCEKPEVIQAYRNQTIQSSREQLQGFVRDLSHDGDSPETLSRMLELASNVTVHAVSSSAYNKLTKVGRLTGDYGITDVAETGIPGVHDQLRQIVQEVGEGLVARTSIARTQQLRDEVAFFFRAEASRNSPQVTRTREALDAEVRNLEDRIEKARVYAKAHLEASREKFLGRVKPLAQTSMQALHRTFDNWRNIHWATLRALMHRDGIFKSPSNGKVHDLNADLTEPLMKHLPLSWEQFFTDDLGRARSDFVLRITEAGGDFGHRVQLIVSPLGVQPDSMLKRQLKWFEEKVTSLAQRCTRTLEDQVGERRRELAHKITLVSKDALKPAFAAAKLEVGPGMKARMLDRIIPAATKGAPVIFATIHTDLTEGTAGLESVFINMLDELLQVTLEQAKTVVGNATIGLDEAAVSPEIRDILDTLPSVGLPA